METLERMPFLARNAVFKKLAEITDISSMTMAERRVYDENLKIMRDHHSVYSTGYEEGEARGIEIGEARGIEIGEARGIEIGEARGRMKTALNLKKEGVSIYLIMKATGLSEEEIERLE